MAKGGRGKAPSPAQKAARAKFTAMVKGKAKGKAKAAPVVGVIHVHPTGG
jgi:hypothetical protein